MSIPNQLSELCFPCDCVSKRVEKLSDPWTAVVKRGLIGDGRKEDILNLVAGEPRTISQLSKELGIAPPSVHTHVNQMTKSEILRESEEWEKLHPKERYYEPNFPVVRAEDAAQFEKLCEETAASFVEIFVKARPEFERAFQQTSLARNEWQFADLTQYLFACIQRRARTVLEGQGALLPAEKHKNGVEWTIWAEERKSSDVPA